MRLALLSLALIGCNTPTATDYTQPTDTLPDGMGVKECVQKTFLEPCPNHMWVCRGDDNRQYCTQHNQGDR